jgi:hypothetical protein
MKICIVCHREIDDDVNFCPHCGAKQPSKKVEPITAMTQEVGEQDKPVAVLIILGVLTICGSLFTIGRAGLYDIFGDIAGDDGIRLRATIYILTSIGTMAGAIMMLLKKRSGLHLYTVCQVLYILTAFYAASVHNVKENLSSVILFFFVAPAILFLVFYWLKDVRKHLK